MCAPSSSRRQRRPIWSIEGVSPLRPLPRTPHKRPRDRRLHYDSRFRPSIAGTRAGSSTSCETCPEFPSKAPSQTPPRCSQDLQSRRCKQHHIQHQVDGRNALCTRCSRPLHEEGRGCPLYMPPPRDVSPWHVTDRRNRSGEFAVGGMGAHRHEAAWWMWRARCCATRSEGASDSPGISPDQCASLSPAPGRKQHDQLRNLRAETYRHHTICCFRMFSLLVISNVLNK